MWEYNYTTSPDELYHYGVPGMKWGHRKKYQTASASMNPAGRAKAKKDANTLSTKNKVAIAAGVTVTAATIAAGAYFVHRYRLMNVDSIIKSGSEIQHLGEQAVKNFDHHIYATHLKSDKKIYLNKNSRGFDTRWKLNQTITSNRDLKIAGTKTALKNFKEFAENNDVYEQRFGKVNLDNKKALKRAYKMFIKESPNQRGLLDTKLTSQYFSKLSERGYDAVRDTFDQSVMKAKSPVIIFNGLENLKTKRVTKV